MRFTDPLRDGFYVLDSATGLPIAVNLRTWARWFDTHPDACRLALDTFDGVTVSTVFLGVDHAYNEGPPLLWETLVQDGPERGTQDRYATETAALKGHAAICARVCRRPKRPSLR